MSEEILDDQQLDQKRKNDKYNLSKHWAQILIVSSWIAFVIVIMLIIMLLCILVVAAYNIASEPQALNQFIENSFTHIIAFIMGSSTIMIKRLKNYLN